MTAFGGQTVLYLAILVGTSRCRDPQHWTRERANLSVNSGLKVTIMLKCRLSNCSKCANTTLMQGVHNKGNCVQGRGFMGALCTINFSVVPQL